jgi:hypothetical protein
VRGGRWRRLILLLARVGRVARCVIRGSIGGHACLEPVDVGLPLGLIGVDSSCLTLPDVVDESELLLLSALLQELLSRCRRRSAGVRVRLLGMTSVGGRRGVGGVVLSIGRVGRLLLVLRVEALLLLLSYIGVSLGLSSGHDLHGFSGKVVVSWRSRSGRVRHVEASTSR